MPPPHCSDRFLPKTSLVPAKNGHTLPPWHLDTPAANLPRMDTSIVTPPSWSTATYATAIPPQPRTVLSPDGRRRPIESVSTAGVQRGTKAGKGDFWIDLVACFYEPLFT